MKPIDRYLSTLSENDARELHRAISADRALLVGRANVLQFGVKRTAAQKAIASELGVYISTAQSITARCSRRIRQAKREAA